MEDILEVYKRPYDASRPVVCMDEKPYQLLFHGREPIPMGEGNPVAKDDYEYVRNGTSSIFLFVEPLAPWRRAEALERRTRIDWAEQVKVLLTAGCPDAEKVALAAGNLNTHNIASLYQAFPAQEALGYAKRLEIHYTPKHGSWLDIAETGLSVMARQCLSRRIGDMESLNIELDAWQERRNAEGRSVDWTFTTEDARVRLRRLYPLV